MSTSTSPVSMISLLKEIDLDKTGLLSLLINDYLGNKQSLYHLYKYPFALSSFRDIIKDKSKDTVDRKLLVEVLNGQYAKIPTTGSVTNNIQSLLADNTFTVVASHQPCLLMGPLFNIYKITGAINLAAQLKNLYPNNNFVPVFWMGSEDHDIEELNNTYINGKKIVWSDAGTGAIGRLNTESLKGVFESLKEFSLAPELMAILTNGLVEYKTFGTFTQYFVNEIFKEYGLVVIDQDDARLKRKFSEVMLDEIVSSTALGLLKQNIEFLEANYKAQAKPRDINFFYLGEGYRERIIYNSLTQKFLVNNTSVAFNVEEIREEIETHPERFSPNVIYRPLYQEMVLPNLAFIGGAGELSYWLELEPLFDHYQVNYPMLILRSSAAIVNAQVIKKLEKLNLKIEDFFGEIESLITRYVKENMAPDISLVDEKNKLSLLFDAIAEKAEGVDATLKQNVAAEKQKALTVLENIEGKMLKAEKRKQETAINQIRSIHAVLFPENTLQERREGFASFYSTDFISEVVREADPMAKTFKFLLKD